MANGLSHVGSLVSHGKGVVSENYFPGAHRYVLYTRNGPEYCYREKTYDGWKKTGFMLYIITISILLFLILAVELVPVVYMTLHAPENPNGGYAVVLFLLFPLSVTFYFAIVVPWKEQNRARKSTLIDPHKEYKEAECPSCRKVYLCEVHPACPHCGGEIPQEYARQV